jgi:peptidoglycan/LPS O-acetylase OafA/YrhL
MAQAERLPGMHAMRLFAALMVFAGHSAFAGLDFEPGLNYASNHFFPMVVPMFFVTSSFALMYSTPSYAGKPHWVRKFFSKRFWRITPLFYIMCVVAVIHDYSRVGLPSWEAIAANALLIFNLTPQHVMSLAPAGWTVGAEFAFYAVFPLLILYVRTFWAAGLLLLVTIVASHLVREPFNQYPLFVGTYTDFSVVTHGPSFVFGLMAYLTFQRMRAAGWGAPDLPRRRVWAYHAFFAAIVLGLGALIVFQIRWLHDHARIDLILSGLLFGLINVWWTVRPARILNWGPIQYFAERSYSMYLLHALIVMHNYVWGRAVYLFLHPYIGGWAITPALIVMLLPILALSVITYALIEKPGIDAGRAFDTLIMPKSRPAPEAA